MNRWLVSAAHKSSGKTTVSIGLCAALRRRGLAVQPFKKGPDYIDPMWLALAAGRACRSLDPHIAGWDEVRAAFLGASAGAAASVVEGNHGLHDGLAADGSDSNAALAVRLELPVILVLDTRGTARGIAPLVLGYQAFEPRLKIAGVVLNRVSGSRHEQKMRQALERYTDVPVIGALGEDARLTLAERHLGLTPSNEAGAAAERVEALADAIVEGLDIDRLIGAQDGAGDPAAPADARPAYDAAPRRDGARPAVRIGVARDEAFGFYYAEDLEALRGAGAELVPFDTLRDARLPQVDGLFIGGGFPEMHAPALQANAALRGEILERIRAGIPVYAECGGLMYLARSVVVGDARYQMVGAIPGDAVMHRRPVGRGYVQLQETGAFPWPGGAAEPVRAHEFHHSSLENLAPGTRWAYRVLRGHGVDGEHDGIVQGNLLASYAHLRSVGGRGWPARFVEFVRGTVSGRRPDAGQRMPNADARGRVAPTEALGC